MKRLLSSLVLVTLLASVQQWACAQEDMQPPPPQDNGPADQGQGPAPDQGPPPDQGGPGPGDQGAPPDQGGDAGVSYQTFYDNLSDQGTWVQTDDYGYVFQPTVSDPNWAPYTDGHWAYTDEGWMWISDEPWGWATYHYGRWCNIDGTGWCWVPGYRWAPAWVSWRYGGGYCGWAPLPPESFIGVEFGGGGGGFGGYRFGGDVDVNFGIGAGYYNFVQVGRFGDSNLRGAIVDRYNNYGIINHTTNITNITINRGGAGANALRGVSAGGPPVNEINARSGHHFETMHLAEANAPGRASIQGNSVSVYAPRVNSATANRTRPASVSRTISHPTFNRGTSVTHPMAVNANLRPAAPSAAAVQQARLAQSQAPASAHLAKGGPRVRSAAMASRPHAETANGAFRNNGAVQPQANVNRTEQPNAAATHMEEEAAARREEAQKATAARQEEAATRKQEAATRQEEAATRRDDAAKATAERREATATEHREAAATGERHTEAAPQHMEEHHTAVHQTEAPRPEQHDAAAKPAPKKDDKKQQP